MCFRVAQNSQYVHVFTECLNLLASQTYLYLYPRVMKGTECYVNHTGSGV